MKRLSLILALALALATGQVHAGFYDDVEDAAFRGTENANMEAAVEEDFRQNRQRIIRENLEQIDIDLDEGNCQPVLLYAVRFPQDIPPRLARRIDTVCGKRGAK